jgi:Protein of unknown function (DUF1353)
MRKPDNRFRCFAIAVCMAVLLVPVAVRSQETTTKKTTTTKKATAKKRIEKTADEKREQEREAKAEAMAAAEQAKGESALEAALDVPESPLTKPFNDMNFLLKEDMHYTVGNSGVTITVPKGFVTDFASIPWQFWSVLPTIGTYSRGAVVHDWLYWEQVCTRDQSDNLFMIAMKESEVPTWKRNAIYLAVHKAGQGAWDGDAAERQAGLIKILTPPNDNVPPNDTWDEYRKKMANAHVPDGPRPTNIAFCQLGNTTDVP